MAAPETFSGDASEDGGSAGSPAIRIGTRDPRARSPHSKIGLAMMNATRQMGLLLALAMMASPLPAQDTQITFGGQIRPRMEGRTPVGGAWDGFASMRARASLEALLRSRVRVFLQFQDVRLFGEETNTLSDYSADHLDLHQGYLELASLGGAGGLLRVGRQELALGEQRLVGAVDWAQQGRSFDGVRYTTPPLGDLRVDLFGMRLSDATAPTQSFDSDFLGAWGALGLGDHGSLDLFGLFTTDSRALGAEEWTFGALWRGDAGPVRWRVEGSVQGGTRGDEDVSAHMLGLRAGTEIPEVGTLTLWYDYLSGDDDPADDTAGAFNTLFATNHAFYGFADYFLNIPVDTGGLGLRDAAVKFSFTPWSQTRLDVDLHNFTTSVQGPLSTRSLGNELDLTLSRPLSPGLTLGAGCSFFQARDGMEELGRLSENGQWLFLMLNAVF